jgi:hypothetical protein
MNDQLVNIGTSVSVPFTHIKASRYAPEGTSTIFVGTQDGRLFKVENMQSTPNATEIGSDDFPTASISCVALGGGEDTLLVTFSNYGVSSVWQTCDGGENWKEKEANLPDMPIRWAIYHPQNNGQALLATETGVWATNTLKEEETEWAPAGDGMANVRVDMLKLRQSDNTVLAATHGRGGFKTNYELVIYTGISNNKALAGISIYPNPASDFVTLEFDNRGYSNIEIAVYDAGGRLTETVNTKKNSCVLNVSRLKQGTYLAVIKADAKMLASEVFIVN